MEKDKEKMKWVDRRERDRMGEEKAGGGEERGEANGERERDTDGNKEIHRDTEEWLRSRQHDRHRRAE